MVEIKCRQLLEVATTIRFQGSIPLKFWEICVQNDAYLINMIPSTVLTGKSPFEKFYGRSPNLHHLRVLGSLCYATNVANMNDKFGARAIVAVHMGYSTTQKGYILYNLADRNFFVSRVVSFKENIFSFKSAQSQVYTQCHTLGDIALHDPFIMADIEGSEAIDQAAPASPTPVPVTPASATFSSPNAGVADPVASTYDTPCDAPVTPIHIPTVETPTPPIHTESTNT